MAFRQNVEGRFAAYGAAYPDWLESLYFCCARAFLTLPNFKFHLVVFIEGISIRFSMMDK